MWALRLVLGRFWGSWSLSHPVHGQVALQAPWRARAGGCRSQGYHGCRVRTDFWMQIQDFFQTFSETIISFSRLKVSIGNGSVLRDI